MTYSIRTFASLCLVSFAAFAGACSIESEDGFVEYGAVGAETGDFEEDEQALDSDGAASMLCGNGNLDAGESCDEGEANADNAACTSTCEINECGDGLVYEGVEECDMGELNGENSSCDLSCTQQ